MAAALNVVALVSGGKDSIYSCFKCIEYGHSITVLANLYPSDVVEQRDSFMYQTQGYELLPAIAECMGLPLERRAIDGKSLNCDLTYDSTKSQGDEVEDLYELLVSIKQKYPEVNAVCSGAVLSTYQRNRIENVCERLKLIPLAYLWNRDQKQLLDEMIENNFEAVLVKVCSMGLSSKQLGQSISQCRDYFMKLERDFGFHVCGEGGEYESIVTDCPLFIRGRLRLDETKAITLENRDMSPICVLDVQRFHIEVKPPSSPTLFTSMMAVNSLDVLRNASTTIKSELIGINSGECLLLGPSATMCEWFVGPIFGITFDEAFNSFSKKVDISKVCYVHLYLRDLSQFSEANQVFEKIFASAKPPARATIELGWMGNNVIAITALTCFQKRSVLHVKSRSEWAPQCIGPYSQCNVMDGNIALIAGQIPLNPGTMNLLSQAPLLEQLKLSMQNCIRIGQDAYVKATRCIGAIIYVNNRRSAISPASTITLVKEALISMPYGADMDLLKLNLVLISVPSLPRDAALEIEMVASTSNADPDDCYGEVFHAVENDHKKIVGDYESSSRVWTRTFTQIDPSKLLPSAKHGGDIVIPVQALAVWIGAKKDIAFASVVRYSLHV